MKSVLLGTAAAIVLTFTAAADATIVSASSGAAYVPSNSECFARNLFGRVVRGSGDDCFDDGDPIPDGHYWTIDLWSSNSSPVSKSFSVYGSSGTPCLGVCTTTCSAIVLSVSGAAVSWTAQHTLVSGGGWRGLTPALTVGGPDTNTSQVECTLGGLDGNWVSAVKVNGAL